MKPLRPITICCADPARGEMIAYVLRVRRIAKVRSVTTRRRRSDEAFLEITAGQAKDTYTVIELVRLAFKRFAAKKHADTMRAMVAAKKAARDQHVERAVQPVCSVCAHAMASLREQAAVEA